ncbi:MAG: ribonuclease H-like domain-containing protein [Chloroflexota bacterium]
MQPDGGRAESIGAERLAAEVDGELIRTAAGAFVRVERTSSVIPIDRERLATLPGQPGARIPLLCLDTETTGLATASGTLAFLVGLGWWEGARFRQVQLLLPDHVDEPALLEELRRLIPRNGWLVTYNGKGFDWPLLVARYRMARDQPPAHAGHLDLLPIVRRLFRHRMTDSKLQTAETELLGMRRHGDVPGWEIPARYLQFLRDGEPARLIEIVRHNDEDVRSLARLLALVETRFGDPDARRQADPGDLAGLARSFGAERRFAEALDCLDAAMVARDRAPLTVARVPVPVDPAPEREVRMVREETDDWWSPRRRPDFGGRHGRSGGDGLWRAAAPDRLETRWTGSRLIADRARLLRRVGRYAEAETAWISVADEGGTLGALAWVEVAKLREHHGRDLDAALAATLAALRLVERARVIGRGTARVERDLMRRSSRLRRRIDRRAAVGRRSEARKAPPVSRLLRPRPSTAMAS